MKISRTIGGFRLDRVLLGLLLVGCALLAGRAWLQDHPEHNPWSPLNLADPPGWATSRKLAALHGDPAECRAVLERSGVEFAQLEPAGEGACRRESRVRLGDSPFGSDAPISSCAVAAGVVYWLRHSVEPAAQELLGSPVRRVEHYGTYSCRRMYNRDDGPWSEHATGNAIDIAGFVLEDGRRVSVLRDWPGEGQNSAFLHRVRDGACSAFSTVLSPEYNAAHADHLHLDQQGRAWGFCR
ncbi:extensin family protein [Altererythrobacter sp. CC-YST694]|uniref:extensin-like domain-containing protein n=1 Tax=Altererythrobacter sp. CC-YST694 TaxID=2755038 RepID=UPI001D00B5A0|nr:extensin family protein [Altererythrobacter sp. CC-YST694]MCB5424358.1 extensin family protein [Altererythrobacter sp. CC-YST694]